MDYKKLIKVLKCDGYGISQDMDGCSNRRCKYRDTDGACNIVSICEDAATAITDLLVENQSLRNAANGFKARAEAAEARAEKAERERDEAVSDLESIMVFGDSGLDTCDFCKNNQCYARSGNNPCLPKWRGQKEE